MAKTSNFNKKNINRYSEKRLIQEIIKKSNSINKKIKQYEDLEVEEYSSFLTSVFNNDYFTENGRLKVGKNRIKELQDTDNFEKFELRKMLTSLISINEHKIYGTTLRYQKAVELSIQQTTDTCKRILIDKGYHEEEVNLMLQSEHFMKFVYMGWKEHKGYGSEQVVEKVYLNYQTMIKDDELQEKVTNFEMSWNERKELNEYVKEEKEMQRWWKENRGKNKR